METTYPVLPQMNIYSISRRHGCREAWLPTVPAVGVLGARALFHLHGLVFTVPARRFRHRSRRTRRLRAAQPPSAGTA